MSKVRSINNPSDKTLATQPVNNIERSLVEKQDAARPTRFCFGEYTLDLNCCTLHKGEQRVELRPQSFEVLRVLIEHHGQLVSKNRLHEEVWGHAVVTDGSLTQCIIGIRKAINDSERKLIKTVPRRGYVFEAALTPETVYNEQRHGSRQRSRYSRAVLVAAAIVVSVFTTLQQAKQGHSSKASHQIPADNSIAVLPFATYSPVEQDSYLTEAIYGDILTSLTKIEYLNVMAQSAVGRQEIADLSTAELGEQLGVRAILEGSVQQASDRIRINVRLIDTHSRHHLWGESYDRVLSTDDALEIQDQVANAVALEIETLFPKRQAHVALSAMPTGFWGPTAIAHVSSYTNTTMLAE